MFFIEIGSLAHSEKLGLIHQIYPILSAVKKSMLCDAKRATQQGFSNHDYSFMAKAIGHYASQATNDCDHSLP